MLQIYSFCNGHFLRYIWLFPLQKLKKNNLITENLSYLFQEHGCPKIIQSDNRGNSQVKKVSFCDRNKIEHITSIPYNSWPGKNSVYAQDFKADA